MGVVYQIEDLDNSSKDLKAQTFQIISCLSGLTDRKKVFKRSLDKLGMTAFFVGMTAFGFLLIGDHSHLLSARSLI